MRTTGKEILRWQRSSLLSTVAVPLRSRVVRLAACTVLLNTTALLKGGAAATKSVGAALLHEVASTSLAICLLYTSDAADDTPC
eukprot:6181196-Pleurochrysis_carterae.AAC.1